MAQDTVFANGDQTPTNWSSTETNIDTGLYRSMYNTLSNVFRLHSFEEQGFSVRCVRDNWLFVYFIIRSFCVGWFDYFSLSRSAGSNFFRNWDYIRNYLYIKQGMIYCWLYSSLQRTLAGSINILWVKV